jgi:hypothetical protein
MEENQDAKSVNANNYPEDKILEDDKDDSFDIARVNLNNRECKPRTAAQPKFRHDTGFQ